MILTLTANSALDRVIFIDEFRPTGVMRTTHVVDSVGGKGFDVSVALQALGAPNLAVGIVAGQTGAHLVRLLDGYGIEHDLLQVEGDTRTAHVIVETATHRHSHITAGGYRVTAAAADALLARLRRHLPRARWLVCAGSLPEGMPQDLYGRATALASECGVATLVDCPGEPLCQALPAKPAVVKLNRHELEHTFAIAASVPERLAGPMEDLRRRSSLQSLVVTCGEEGLLAVTPAGAYLAAAPAQEAVNAAGAGDAASAALTWRLFQGEPWPEALRWAAAAGAAVALTEGTADCRMEDVRRIYTQVSVRPVSTAGPCS